MAGFDASGVVEPLDYNFMPYIQAKGTTPEPSDARIEAFVKGLQEITKKYQGRLELPEDAQRNPEALFAAMDNLDASAITEVAEEMAALYAELCSDQPSAHEIQSLPLRVRSKFFQYLQREVINPEADPGAGTAQVVHLRTAAAG